MFYREAGDFSKTYREDSQTFPIKFDRYRYYAILLIAFAVVEISFGAAVSSTFGTHLGK